jgi:hypothetical protein
MGHYRTLIADPAQPIRDLRRRVSSLERQAHRAPEATHLVGASGEPSFSQYWANYGAPTRPCGFYADRGRVWLQGLVAYKSSGSSDGYAIFTLPTGYRPSDRVWFAAAGDPEGARASVETSGNVVCRSNVNWLGLNNVTFRVA